MEQPNRVFLREARAVVPAAWSQGTVGVALATVNHTVTVGVVSAAAKQLAEEVLKVMLLKKLTLASVTLLAAGLIGWGATAALVSLETRPRRRRLRPRHLPSGRPPNLPSGNRNRPHLRRTASSRFVDGCSTPPASQLPAPAFTSPLCRGSVAPDRPDGLREGAGGSD